MTMQTQLFLNPNFQPVKEQILSQMYMYSLIILIRTYWLSCLIAGDNDTTPDTPAST